MKSFLKYSGPTPSAATAIDGSENPRLRDAKDALIKRFPLAGKDIKKNDDNWVLDTLVYSMEVPCRFVLSLADEINIIDSPELSDYVASYYEKHLKPLFTTQN